MNRATPANPAAMLSRINGVEVVQPSRRTHTPFAVEGLTGRLRHPPMSDREWKIEIRLGRRRTACGCTAWPASSIRASRVIS
jgi:hypothetical protein